MSVRVGDPRCEKGHVVACRYDGDGGVTIFAASPENGDMLQSIVLAFSQRDSDVHRMVESLGVVSLIYAPLASRGEIEEAVTSVFDAITARSMRRVELGDIGLVPTVSGDSITIGVSKLQRQ